jgi:putative methyltransferase (TIGR04325 family)
MNLSDFIPPIVTKLARRIRHSNQLFDSYDSAYSSLSSVGYEEDSLVAVVYEKTKRYRDILMSQRPLVFDSSSLSDLSSLRTFVGLCLATSKKELNVLDFGGACGAHYFLARALIGNRVNLRWHVVETPIMANTARGLEDGRIRFYDDLIKAKSEFELIDLVFSSSALQCVPRPYEFLTFLTECGALNVFITRGGLSTFPKELIIIQESKLSNSGPGPMPQGMRDSVVKFPVTFGQKSKFEEIINKNYLIQVQFHEEKNVYWAGEYPIDYYGYFGSLRSTVT